MIRIIDNKKVEMTDSEYRIYQQLCEKYTEKYFRGQELFKELFQANDAGIIIFVKPPNNRKFSMEIYCFMLSLMTNQHLRINQEQQSAFIKEATEKHLEIYNSYKEKIKNLEDDLRKKSEIFDVYVKYLDTLKKMKSSLNNIKKETGVDLEKTFEEIDQIKKMMDSIDTLDNVSFSESSEGTES